MGNQIPVPGAGLFGLPIELLELLLDLLFDVIGEILTDRRLVPFLHFRFAAECFGPLFRVAKTLLCF